MKPLYAQPTKVMDFPGQILHMDNIGHAVSVICQQKNRLLLYAVTKRRKHLQKTFIESRPAGDYSL